MSVAIRAITRLQDADDVNISLGAGVDEHALCWDNDTARFVLRAVSAGVTDHGALTGLTPDDDHTQYALLAGRAGGQTIYGGTAANDDITIQGTSNATRTTSYVILQPTAGNVGIGTSTPSVALDVSGAARLTSLLEVNSSRGAGNALVVRAYSVAGTNMQNWYDHDNQLRAYMTSSGGLRINSGAGSVTPIAGEPMGLVVGNIMIGRSGSSDITMTTADSLSLSSGGENPVSVNPGSSDGSGGFRVGSGAGQTRFTVLGTGLVGIGTTAPGSLLHALLTSAATNAVTNVVTIGHDTSGTAAAGFGAGQLFALESSTTAAQSAARIQALWYQATHATRKADLVLTAYDTAEREGLRIRGAGSAPAIGFLGATPAARIAHVADPAGGATVDAEARSAINSILATLETFGFHATS